MKRKVYVVQNSSSNSSSRGLCTIDRLFRRCSSGQQQALLLFLVRSVVAAWAVERFAGHFGSRSLTKQAFIFFLARAPTDILLFPPFLKNETQSEIPRFAPKLLVED